MNRLILFLIIKKLGLKQYEKFRFTNQKTPDIYWFDKTGLHKTEYRTTPSGKVQPVAVMLSGVSLNWLLDKDCKIEKVTEEL